MEKDPERGVVYNACYGGFAISDEGMTRWKKLRADRGLSCEGLEDECCTPRNCPHLVALVEEDGAAMSGECAKLKVRYIGEEAARLGAWRITEYDGLERVLVKHDEIERHREAAVLKKTFRRLLHEGGESAEERLELLRMLAPQRMLDEEQGYQAPDKFARELTTNARHLPGVGDAFAEAKEHFENARR